MSFSFFVPVHPTSAQWDWGPRYLLANRTSQIPDVSTNHRMDWQRWGVAMSSWRRQASWIPPSTGCEKKCDLNYLKTMLRHCDSRKWQQRIQRSLVCQCWAVKVSWETNLGVKPFSKNPWWCPRTWHSHPNSEIRFRRIRQPILTGGGYPFYIRFCYVLNKLCYVYNSSWKYARSILFTKIDKYVTRHFSQIDCLSPNCV